MHPTTHQAAMNTSVDRHAIFEGVFDSVLRAVRQHGSSIDSMVNDEKVQDQIMSKFRPVQVFENSNICNQFVQQSIAAGKVALVHSHPAHPYFNGKTFKTPEITGNRLVQCKIQFKQVDSETDIFEIKKLHNVEPVCYGEADNEYLDSTTSTCCQ